MQDDTFLLFLLIDAEENFIFPLVFGVYHGGLDFNYSL